MNFAKILGLLAIAVSALTSFAATASADVATSPTGTVYTSTLKAAAEGHAVLDNPIAKIECASTVEGTITKHGAGQSVSGPISSLTFGSPVGTCTNGWHVTVVTGGTLSVNGTAGSYNGHVFSSGATVESTITFQSQPCCHAVITCRYATNNTTIGTLTGGQTATLHINASIPFHSGSPFCGTGATAWTGSYIINTPDSLYIDKT